MSNDRIIKSQLDANFIDGTVLDAEDLNKVIRIAIRGINENKHDSDKIILGKEDSYVFYERFALRDDLGEDGDFAIVYVKSEAEDDLELYLKKDGSWEFETNLSLLSLLGKIKESSEDSEEMLNQHKEDFNNPHEVTAEQLNVYTKEEVNNKLASAMTYKGSVAHKSDLPKTGNRIGDFYNVRDSGINFAWDGYEWDQVGGFADMIFNQITAKDVMVTLEDGHDVTFTHQDLDSIYIIIPELEHGYFSGFNYRTKNKDIPTTIINNSGFPLKIFKYNLQMSSIEMSPNKVVNVSLHCDGINLYMYYTEN